MTRERERAWWRDATHLIQVTNSSYKTRGMFTTRNWGTRIIVSCHRRSHLITSSLFLLYGNFCEGLDFLVWGHVTWFHSSPYTRTKTFLLFINQFIEESLPCTCIIFLARKMLYLWTWHQNHHYIVVKK